MSPELRADSASTDGMRY